MANEERGFWDVLTSREFWIGLACTVGIEFVRSFLKSMGESLINYSGNKLGQSLLPPTTPRPTAYTPPSMSPPPPPAPPYGQQTPSQELFPTFKYR